MARIEINLHPDVERQKRRVRFHKQLKKQLKQHERKLIESKDPGYAIRSSEERIKRTLERHGVKSISELERRVKPLARKIRKKGPLGLILAITQAIQKED